MCPTASSRRANLLITLATLACVGTARGNDLDRDRDPVVLTGADVPSLIGVSPDRVVAFRHDGAWHQVPVQVDERSVVDFGTIYDVEPTGLTILTYTDAGTFTGADPDPTFDADDEVVFMAGEAGVASTADAEPEHALAGSGVELTVTDPVGGGVAYLYLFESDGSLDPGAGANPVTYDFQLLSGDYLTTYDTMSGPNPENTTVTTDAYSVHFGDRWIRDETSVTSGGASGVDILDRHKALFAPGVCTRSEDTFSSGEGAFIVNRGGPVRALRGYVGANSGPTTHRIHLFYPEREDIRTVLRVHAIAGIMDFFDYSPGADGMNFRNDLNPDSVRVDGVPDAVVPGEFTWEMVTGAQGTLAMTMSIDTDIPGFDYTSYYSDDSTPSTRQCTGDDFEYASSGLWETDPIPNTDPALGEFNVFEGLRALTFGPPDQTTAFAEDRAAEALNPVTAVGAPYDPGTVVVNEALPSSGRPSLALAPNPFRAHAHLRFFNPSPGTVTIRLFDVAGRAVATWARGVWDAGEHDVAVNADGLPQGTYFARITAKDGRFTTRRVLILR